jgi:hypothetical protein
MPYDIFSSSTIPLQILNLIVIPHVQPFYYNQSDEMASEKNWLPVTISVQWISTYLMCFSQCKLF